MASVYEAAVLREIARSRFADLNDNFDRFAHGTEPPPPKSTPRVYWDKTKEVWTSGSTLSEKLKARLPLSDLAKFYFTPRAYFRKHAGPQIANGEFLYELLDDNQSRELLVKIMAYRVLGHRKIKLPRNTKKYWADIDRAIDTKTTDLPIPIKFMNTSLACYNLQELGYNFSCYASGAGIACAVIQKQYEYHSESVHCKPEAGDIVFDCGGCWGETSLYFAHEVGNFGKVIAFEFIPGNLEVLNQNISLNPRLQSQMHLVDRPLWSSAGQKVYYVDWGPGSRVTPDEELYHSGDGVSETTTIDGVVTDLALPRVDFIKMDIEGAELDSLRGGEEAIRRYRPKLAISLYHRIEEFDSIPRYLDSLQLGYKFYLEHHTIYQNETVLFAVPSKA